jgi:uncharacterized protein YdcH (DUF465 family)
VTGVTSVVVEKLQANDTGYAKLLSRKEELESRMDRLWRHVDKLKAEGRPHKEVEERLLRLLDGYEKLCDTIMRYYQG